MNELTSPLTAAINASATVHPRTKEWNEAIALVRSLNEAQLIEFFYEAVAPRRKVFIEPNGDFEIECYTIAKSDFYRWKGEDTSHDAETVALPTAHQYLNENAREYDLCIESGRCSRCTALVCSVAKSAVCPICAGEIGLT